MIETSSRILDSAERLFAEHGYAATSLRRIMAEAGVNVAAVHYYFRSKESLLEAVLMRRVGPANEERLRSLDEYERSLGGQRPELERLLEAFLYPTLRMAADPEQGGYTFVRLLGRLQAESDALPGIVASRFGPVLLRYADALARALPELPPNELFLRARLAMGATAQILRDAPAVRSLVSDDRPDWKSLLDRLIPFLSAGFRAPLGVSSRQPLQAAAYGTAESFQEQS